MNDEGKGDDFDVEACWKKVKQALSASHITTNISSTVRTSELSVLFLPNNFSLSLTSPAASEITAGYYMKVICTVLTNTLLFTDVIQANIKFSVKNKVCKDSVPYCMEECKLSEDRKSFQIAFLMQRPGN